MKVLAVGGGSGGHVTPVVAVVEQLVELDPKLEVHMVCDRKFEAQTRGLMKNAALDVKVSVIGAGKFRRYSHLTFLQHFTVPHVVWGNLTDIAKIMLGFLQSFVILIANRPDVVFAKGGYVCLPLGLAAWLLRIPMVIHDSDTRPGLTNRILAKFARKIATGSPLENYNYDPQKSVYLGVPIGSEFKPVDSEKQQQLKAKLGFSTNQKLIVTTGGGLGSQTINDAAIKAASTSSNSTNWYVVAGKKHYQRVLEQSAGMDNVTVTEFVFDHMEDVLGAADVVVSRASATFLQELAGLKKAVIAVPAKQLSDQIKNAQMFDRAEAAIILKDDEIIQTNVLGETVERLVADDDLSSRLASNLHDFARPRAARDLAELIVDVSGKKA